MNETKWKKWQCIFCETIYSEEAGDPENNVKPGTRWEDMPDKWYCPGCGAGKADFDPI